MPKFHMRYGIGSQQQLNPIQARQQRLGDIPTPCAGLSHSRKRLVDMPHHSVQKGTSARSRVKNNGVAICQTSRPRKVRLQQHVYRAHHIAHYRLRGAIDAALFAGSGGIGGQEGFIKMHHRIWLTLRLAKMPEHSRHIGMGQQICTRIYQRGNRRIKRRASKQREKLLKRGGTGGEGLSSIPAAKIGRMGSRNPGRKQAIHHRLGIHIGKVGRRECG